MKTTYLSFACVAAILASSACNKSPSAAGPKDVQTSEASKAAGSKTIAAGLPGNSQFMAAAKVAGLDQTLAGPGPYTVFVPSDQAIAAAPAGSFTAAPANRAQLTGIITNLILPGTVLVADIEKAIDAGKGKATLATMGGGTLTATKADGKTILADSEGHKATIVQGDQQYSNGVVHGIDGLILPAKSSASAAPQVGDKAPR